MTKFGMLFQGSALFDSLPVWENVAFGLIQGQGMARKAAKDQAVAKLANVGLGADVAELFPAELSGGMQKRVSLARAIATEPEIIFFDEPTTGIDPISANIVDRLIRDLSDRLGVTSIVVSHDLRSIFGVADRVAMLYKGQLVLDGPPSLYRETDNAIVQQFINGRPQGPMEV
jgi:phospholipid/cholesterol/gamma-HCH transport system ATP-binding protein